mmetsp:Transcript_26332/g.73588  ORF Transcript_26332/g.73588 Transcript_26332/m.73588 type:complete len:186 (-) Transcript_26332:321-878(-)|eukprot:CAMPEP_0119121568 /NCGR_PEP_ID=MMETSP1310-20130426/2140_1 /TAXON_ID=464262 /ORGANISM="Genus nov. species nov., Strain RCC2339" /LENGTH=185 /DNA_ID=CAMNT_0007111139 /DNA_START=81 /DNA_END=638 /DNA_ORIENTATION=+
MSYVLVTGVEVVQPIGRFSENIPIDITFECHQPLSDDLEWRVIYVGSAEDEGHDQELENVLVGPVPLGMNKFHLDVAAPDPERIPQKDLLGVTVILITCSYRGQEFFRAGYYVNNNYDNEEMRSNPPAQPQLDRILRNVLAGKPRVTFFQINWDSGASLPFDGAATAPDVGDVNMEDDSRDLMTM